MSMDRIYHPIIESPHLYDIDFFSYKFNEEDNSKSYIDLHLKKGDELIQLRFWGLKTWKLKKGFLGLLVAMFIEDIRSHGLESLGIYVGDFEASNGSVTFWAKSVERFN